MDHTILIVDDSPFIVDGLVAILKREGYTPIPAPGGNECLETLRHSHPDLILLDIMMEPMDGWETLEQIKKDPATRDIPVLMFSAKKISFEEAQEHHLDIDDFVSKPVNPAQLMSSIRQIFDRRNAVKMEARVAEGAGLDQALIGEYTSLRTAVEVDKNLVAVLKNARGISRPGSEVSPDDVRAIQTLEEKIAANEKRLREINELFSRTP